MSGYFPTVNLLVAIVCDYPTHGFRPEGETFWPTANVAQWVGFRLRNIDRHPVDSDVFPNIVCKHRFEQGSTYMCSGVPSLFYR